jgi:predicted O-methyltransferase YrrM
MKRVKHIIKNNQAGRILLIPYRILKAISYYKKPLGSILHWSIRSCETTNFTYNLEDLNKKYLINLVAAFAGCVFDEVKSYVEELKNDQALERHVREIGREKGRYYAKSQFGYRRRILRYAIIRATKPRVIIEAGTDIGMGTCVISAALMKNSQEGRNGYLYSIDFNREAGMLYTEPYTKWGRILFGDCVEMVKTVPDPIDLYIHDTYPDPINEKREYEAIQPKISDNGLIISEYAHLTDVLLDFALKTDRKFSYFQEKPKGHWYPGVGIGIACKKRAVR